MVVVTATVEVLVPGTCAEIVIVVATSTEAAVVVATIVIASVMIITIVVTTTVITAASEVATFETVVHAEVLVATPSCGCCMFLNGGAENIVR